jgi:hypothetical protein
VALEEFLLLVIELGAEPIREDWEEILGVRARQYPRQPA